MNENEDDQVLLLEEEDELTGPLQLFDWLAHATSFGTTVIFALAGVLLFISTYWK